ncbi:MAG: metallophosphoesterase family protein [Promethearchaeota archaeon]
MTVKIAILGDTHLTYFKNLPIQMLDEIKEADWVIHVGDYINIDVLNGLIELKGEKFKGVYGNADPSYIRDKIPSKEIIEILRKRIGFTHPPSGGSHEIIESKVINEFKDDNVDIIIFGHTHDPLIKYRGKNLLINPGKGYLESGHFQPPATIIILNIDDKVRVELKEIKF